MFPKSVRNLVLAKISYQDYEKILVLKKANKFTQVLKFCLSSPSDKYNDIFTKTNYYFASRDVVSFSSCLSNQQAKRNMFNKEIKKVIKENEEIIKKMLYINSKKQYGF